MFNAFARGHLLNPGGIVQDVSMLRSSKISQIVPMKFFISLPPFDKPSIKSPSDACVQVGPYASKLLAVKYRDEITPKRATHCYAKYRMKMESLNYNKCF